MSDIKSRSDIVSALQHLKMADEHFISFCNEHKGSKGARHFGNYSQRINWICRDLYTNPHLPESVRLGIKQEVESDVFSVPAISEKIALLKPEQRECLEEVIDRLIAGEELIVNDLKD
jgi:hypothetical protein